MNLVSSTNGYLLSNTTGSTNELIVSSDGKLSLNYGEEPKPKYLKTLQKLERVLN